MEKRRVAITGVGIISPIGNTKEEFWNSILSGKSGVARLRCFDPSNFSSHIGAEVKDFDPTVYITLKNSNEWIDLCNLLFVQQRWLLKTLS
jgi:3-oxoacyl-[acyl-carrier-protein] synthase II